MLLSLLSKFVASLLVMVLFTASTSVVFDQTLLSSHFLETQLESTGSYNRLADAFSEQVVAKSGSTDPAMRAKLRTILTPEVIRQKLNGALGQMQAYYKGNGPVPVIDLTDVAAQAQAAGLPIGPDSGLDKPIVLSSSPEVKKAANTFAAVRTATIIGAAALAVCLALLAWRCRSYKVLANVLISLGILLALVGTAFVVVPGVAANHLKLSADTVTFSNIVKDLAKAVTHAIGIRFWLAAATCLVVGIGVRVWLAQLQARSVRTARTK